jgi:hypothetical protein
MKRLLLSAMLIAGAAILWTAPPVTAGYYDTCSNVLGPKLPPECKPDRPYEQVDNIYLCYSKFQDVPGYWAKPQAVDLFAQGYWQPTAMPGSQEGGMNIGAHHLVCNPVGATLDGMFLTGSGEVVGPEIARAEVQPGYYATAKA